MPKVNKPRDLNEEWHKELVRKGFFIPSHAIITEISYEYRSQIRAKWIIGGIEYEAVQMRNWYDYDYAYNGRYNKWI